MWLPSGVAGVSDKADKVGLGAFAQQGVDSSFVWPWEEVCEHRSKCHQSYHVYYYFRGTSEASRA